jgi:YjbE family integral membrane protein
VDFWAELSAFAQIILIDITLAGDNAIVVGMAAAGLPAAERHRAIIVGIGAAAVMRIVFAFFAIQLLNVVGLTLAGGLLLLWVSWKLYEQLRGPRKALASLSSSECANVPGQIVSCRLRDAIVQIVVADVSMSLDNVLAVAGAAREHPWIMILGLALSVVLMGAASTVIVRLLHRFRWIGYLGLLVVVYVAGKMIYEGAFEVAQHLPVASLALVAG